MINKQNRISILSIVFLGVVIISFSNSNKSFGQNENSITDFYEYVNRDWLDSTILPENTSVVNNWGILWNKIIDQSIEILSGDLTYDLEKDHLYTLNQLRNFYHSTTKYSNDNRKRVELVHKHYPMLFGILFSKITVPPEKEEKIKKLIKHLRDAYAIKIKNSNKIGDYYKDFFLSKLEIMEFEIGAPNLSGFPKMPILSKNTFDKNIQLSVEYQLAQKAKVNNAAWETPPFETDCRYSLQDNKVKIYAGTLYATNFTKEEKIELYFATIGRTIAHEMTHAFDNIGKNYNENGDYIGGFKKLFSGALFSKNDQKVTYQSLIKQFNKYKVQDSFYVNGEKTLQENFADLGGVEISFLALKRYLEANQPSYSREKKSNVISQYFISYAQFWREKGTPEFKISSLDRIHTPQKFRALGPVHNQDEFYENFEIDTASDYYIPKKMRTRIW